MNLNIFLHILYLDIKISEPHILTPSFLMFHSQSGRKSCWFYLKPYAEFKDFSPLPDTSCPMSHYYCKILPVLSLILPDSILAHILLYFSNQSGIVFYCQVTSPPCSKNLQWLLICFRVKAKVLIMALNYPCLAFY